MPVTDDSEPMPDEAEKVRRRLERVLPELIKRVVEAGVGRLSSSPDNVRQLISELKLPKEVLHVLLSQLDETKSGLYRTVSKELRDFLEHTSFADELARALTRLSLEIKTEVRFIPNDSAISGGIKPDVRSKVHVSRRERSSTAPPPPSAEPASGTEDPVDRDVSGPATSTAADAGSPTGAASAEPASDRRTPAPPSPTPTTQSTPKQEPEPPRTEDESE